MKENNSTSGTIVVKSNFYIRFLGELNVQKRHFEMNGPLGRLELNALYCMETFRKKCPIFSDTVLSQHQRYEKKTFCIV